MSVPARLSLANRSLVGLLSLLVIGFGVFSLPSIKQQLFPSIELPAAVVIAPFPGASPDLVDRQVAEPIQAAVRGVESSATVQVMFTYGTGIDAAVATMQQAVNRLQPRLPQGVEPTVAQGGTDDIPVIARRDLR